MIYGTGKRNTARLYQGRTRETRETGRDLFAPRQKPDKIPVTAGDYSPERQNETQSVWTRSCGRAPSDLPLLMLLERGPLMRDSMFWLPNSGTKRALFTVVALTLVHS